MASGILRRLYLDAKRLKDGHDLYDVQLLLSIPTLRYFSSQYLTSWTYGPDHNNSRRTNTARPPWDPTLVSHLETVAMHKAKIAPPDMIMAIRCIPKLTQLLYSDENRFRFGEYRPPSNSVISWTSVDSYIDHFVACYGPRWDRRGLDCSIIIENDPNLPQRRFYRQFNITQACGPNVEPSFE